MKTAVVVFLALAVVACLPGHRESLVGSSGKTNYTVECLDDEKNCRPQSEALCPHGYKVVGSKPHLVAIWQGVDVVNRIRFNQTIECHE